MADEDLDDAIREYQDRQLYNAGLEEAAVLCERLASSSRHTGHKEQANCLLEVANGIRDLKDTSSDIKGSPK